MGRVPPTYGTLIASSFEYFFLLFPPYGPGRRVKSPRDVLSSRGCLNRQRCECFLFRACNTQYILPGPLPGAGKCETTPDVMCAEPPCLLSWAWRPYKLRSLWVPKYRWYF